MCVICTESYIEAIKLLLLLLAAMMTYNKVQLFQINHPTIVSLYTNLKHRNVLKSLKQHCTAYNLYTQPSD